MMPWSAEQTDLINGCRIRVKDKQRRLSFGELFELLASNDDFATWYSNLLCAKGPSAFFWEHPPLTRTTVSEVGEFVLLDAPALEGCQPDTAAFANQFAASDSQILQFANLGGDAQLLVPRPLESTSHYAHLAAFLRTAPTTQVRDLWRQTALLVATMLDDQPLWLSTSGLGIAWLHIRLDSQPKYYQYRPYTLV